MASRPQSAKSFGTVGSSDPSLHFINSSETSQKITDFLKLVSILMPLIVALTTLATLSMHQANNKISISNTMVESLRKGEAVRAVVDSLQRERGMSCVYINSQGRPDASSVLENVLRFRLETDQAWSSIDGWAGDKRFPTKDYFNIEINQFRGNMAIEYTRCSPILDYYTDLIDYLLIKKLQTFTQSSEGKFWVTLDAYYSLLKVKDVIGLKRATGGAFFAAETYEPVTLQNFIGLKKMGDYMLKTAQETLPEVDEQLHRMKQNNAELIHNLEVMEQDIFSETSSPHQPSVQKSQAWFFNMTEYMELYTIIEENVNIQLETELKKVSSQIKFNFDLVLGIVIVTSIVCPISLTIYSLKYQQLMKKIRIFTSKINSKQNEVEKEKQKTEVLLHQLLPKAIANDLLRGKHVPPEHFESVTVFFSDIKGFTALSASSTPFQITEFLNKLYSNCDAILELYDCYKVETIGDAYLIASGVPSRNTHHSEQICTMSLDILRMMSDFPIPHRPWEKLLMRIGVHTGPLAAGVVGLKMPRYCLFGDTVNTAARMESTGFPNRIQISQVGKDHLDSIATGMFTIEYRDAFNIKGKGEMNTYWVLSKRGFNFTIDLEETERIMENTDYWRLGHDGKK